LVRNFKKTKKQKTHKLTNQEIRRLINLEKNTQGRLQKKKLTIENAFVQNT
jgi:hypothetical protein